jgi:hypothetical protein
MQEMGRLREDQRDDARLGGRRARAGGPSESCGRLDAPDQRAQGGHQASPVGGREATELGGPDRGHLQVDRFDDHGGNPFGLNAERNFYLAV